VNDLLGRLDEEQERRVNSLVDVYQRMRAKDAAEVFDGLEDDVLVQVASPAIHCWLVRGANRPRAVGPKRALNA
jgi:hypothetical protein